MEDSFLFHSLTKTFKSLFKLNCILPIRFKSQRVIYIQFSIRISKLLEDISAQRSSFIPFTAQKRNYGLIGTKVRNSFNSGYKFFSFQYNSIKIVKASEEKFVNRSFTQFISIPFEAINMSSSDMVDTVIIGAVYSSDKLFVKRKYGMRKYVTLIHSQL